MHNSENFNLFNEAVKMMAVCPVCKKQYSQSSAKMVNESEDAHLLHIRCGECNSAVLAIVFTTGFGITSMGVLTDLDIVDAGKLCDNSVISEDDILEMYQLLKQEKTLAI